MSAAVNLMTIVYYQQYSLFPRSHSYCAATEQQVGSYLRTLMVFMTGRSVDHQEEWWKIGESKKGY